MRGILLLTGLLFLVAAQVEWDPRVGETVLARWEPDSVYFVGTVVEEERGRSRVVFEDGDVAWVDQSGIRPVDITRGSRVLARWSDGLYYPGSVVRIVGRALFIKYDDGDEGWTSWAGIARRPQ